MKKYPTWCAWIVLIIGIIYLLKDLGVWTWWPFEWYTVLFVLFGLGTVFKKK